jgi:hypothetical protein
VVRFVYAVNAWQRTQATIVWGLLLSSLSLCLSVSTSPASPAATRSTNDVAMVIPAGDFARTIGPGSLADPSGKNHSTQEIKGKVVVAIFSVPSMSQGEVQEKWAKLLVDQADTKVPDAVSLILIEDMSQAGMFKGAARTSMKKDFTDDSRPFLILDETGAVFKKFGVPRNHTEILIYDKTGSLRDVEIDLKDTKTTDKRIRAICGQLQAE